MIDFYETNYKILLRELRLKAFKVGVCTAYRVGGEELYSYLYNLSLYTEFLEDRIEKLEKKTNIEVLK